MLTWQHAPLTHARKKFIGFRLSNDNTGFWMAKRIISEINIFEAICLTLTVIFMLI